MYTLSHKPFVMGIYKIIIIIIIYKEWGSLRSPTPCLCMDFICVSTAWKVISCMVHQSHSVSMNNKRWLKGQVYSKFQVHLYVRTISISCFDVIDDQTSYFRLVNSLRYLTSNDGKASPSTTFCVQEASPRSSSLAGYGCHR